MYGHRRYFSYAQVYARSDLSRNISTLALYDRVDTVCLLKFVSKIMWMISSVRERYLEFCLEWPAGHEFVLAVSWYVSAVPSYPLQ